MSVSKDFDKKNALTSILFTTFEQATLSYQVGVITIENFVFWSQFSTGTRLFHEKSQILTYRPQISTFSRNLFAKISD